MLKQCHGRSFVESVWIIGCLKLLREWQNYYRIRPLKDSRLYLHIHTLSTFRGFSQNISITFLGFGINGRSCSWGLRYNEYAPVWGFSHLSLFYYIDRLSIPRNDTCRIRISGTSILMTSSNWTKKDICSSSFFLSLLQMMIKKRQRTSQSWLTVKVLVRLRSYEQHFGHRTPHH